MKPLLNIGRKRNRNLSELLSAFLSRTREGKEMIRAFEKDRRAASAVIATYVDQYLKDQPEFRQQLDEVLGKKESNRFYTLMANGAQVGQIINAEVVEHLQIRYVIFEDNSQVVTFLVGLVLIGATVASLYWWSIQPRRMNGDFNIAVAQFSQLGHEEPKAAEIISQQVFRFLDDQAKLITFEDIQVSHKNIRVITSAEEAKAIAKRINAQVVLYGDVTAIGEQVHLTPQFYIAEAFRANVAELNGQQKLAAPISFPIGDLLDPTSVPMTLIQERTVIMTEFTKALVYLALNNLPLAKESIDRAIQHSELQRPFDGQEVLYLFASEIARLQGNQASAEIFANDALDINPEYGRGYIVMANIYYDQENLFQAVQTYKKAKELPNQPFGAYIVEKASLGIGNSCWVQLQYVNQTAEPDPAAVADLEQCALDNYQQLIELYTQHNDPELNLKEMAAWAYYGVGNVAKSRGQFQEAQKMYEQGRKLTTDPELIQRIESNLKEVNQ